LNKKYYLVREVLVQEDWRRKGTRFYQAQREFWSYVEKKK
jgi:hypothetical protein